VADEDAAGEEAEAAALKEQLHDKLLPVVLAFLRMDRLSGEFRTEDGGGMRVSVYSWQHLQSAQ